MLTSFAQALEDVVLSRALGPIEAGFYIDAGANDPVIDSVTKLFYDRGWSGVNVEPSPTWFEKVASDRPRDVNLNLALSDAAGVAVFHEIEGSGLSTVIEGIAARHETQGRNRRTYEVKTDTLAAICDRYAPPTIHFLKVDVEGAEEKVLRGANFQKYRPWIVLVEATEPMSDTPSYKDWEPLLTEAGYDFALFDGLNRFYVARERSDLKACFSVRGDQYQTISTVWTIGHWRILAEQREAENSRLAAELAAAHNELAVIKRSVWWNARERAKSLVSAVRSR